MWVSHTKVFFFLDKLNFLLLLRWNINRIELMARMFMYVSLFSWCLYVSMPKYRRKYTHTFEMKKKTSADWVSYTCRQSVTARVAEYRECECVNEWPKWDRAWAWAWDSTKIDRESEHIWVCQWNDCVYVCVSDNVRKKEGRSESEREWVKECEGIHKY